MSTIVTNITTEVTVPAATLFDILKEHDENFAKTVNDMSYPVNVTFDHNALHLHFNKRNRVK